MISSRWLRIRCARHGDGPRRKRGDLSRGGERHVVDFGGVDNSVDDAGVFCFRSGQRTAHDEHRERPRIAHAHGRKQRRGRFGNEPELDERRRQNRGGTGDHVIAMQQHGRADADGHAVDRRDQRLLPAGQRVEKLVRARIEPASRGFEKIGDVVARAEGAGDARDHDATDGVVLIALAQRPGHVGIHRKRQRVFLFRAIDPDGADAAVIGYRDGFAHDAPLPISTRRTAVRQRAPSLAAPAPKSRVGGSSGHYYGLHPRTPA